MCGCATRASPCPSQAHKAAEGRGIVWRLPLYNTVHNILTNPVYAGAYAFGRTMSKVSVENGRKRVKRGLRRPQAEWDVLLKDQHEGYITWSEFERNQRVIADNATGKGAAVRGAVRRGELLLAGLLRCGHCGRKLYVGYGGKAGRYYCQGALVNHGTGAMHLVRRLARRSCRRHGGSSGLEAARHRCRGQGAQAQTGETSAAQRQLELALQQARFEAAHARRQYDAVDPANRLVAGELERRWNEALQVVQRIEGEIAALEARKPAPLGEKERQHLMQLGADLELAWSHPAATAATRKRILRAALHEIVVRVEGEHHRDGPALAGRRPHRAEAEDEWGRQAPLDDTRGYLVADPRVGAPDARPANRAAPQSRRQADRAGVIF